MRLRRGGVLLTVLVCLTALVALVAVEFARQRSEMQARFNRVEGMKAESMAESGVAHALAILAEQEPGLVLQTDPWFEFGQGGTEVFLVADGSYRVQILDAGSRLSLNTATEEDLTNLGLPLELIEPLLDWREPELDPRPEGAKDEFYRGLEEPYNAKLRPFESVEELLLLRNWTAPILYRPIDGEVEEPGDREDPERYWPFDVLTADSLAPAVGPDGQPKLDINAADVEEMTERGVDQVLAEAIVDRRNDEGTFQTLAEAIRLPGVDADNVGPILDVLTVGEPAPAPGRINVNTATEQVLRAVEGLPEDAVQSIVSRAGTFESLGELASVPGFDLDVLADLSERFTIGSAAFLVRVVGSFGEAERTIEAVVRLDEDGVRVSRYRSIVEREPLELWRWTEETDVETVIWERA